MHKLVASSLASLLVASQVFAPAFMEAQPGDRSTATPIQHVVVIFQENVSFDHYFGTYPFALNPKGEPRFTALPGCNCRPGPQLRA
jgi:phospholipase C